MRTEWHKATVSRGVAKISDKEFLLVAQKVFVSMPTAQQSRFLSKMLEIASFSTILTQRYKGKHKRGRSRL